MISFVPDKPAKAVGRPDQRLIRGALAREGHVAKQQERQTAEILEVTDEKHVSIPMTEALYERVAAIDEGRYRRLTGQYPDFDYRPCGLHLGPCHR